MQTIDFLNRTIPALGIGTWYLGEGKNDIQVEKAAIQNGIEHGIKLIDTAEMYGEGLAEKLVGESIKPYERDDLLIVSKVYPWNATKRQTRHSLEQSLRNLQTDYLDLYLLHWREDVPLQESLESLMELKEEGKIRAWGVSNFDINDLQEVHAFTNDCTTNQVLYNLGSRGIEFSLLPYMAQKNMPLMAYSPLGHGLTPFQHQPIIQQLCRKYTCTTQQLLLAWVTTQHQTIAIAKASSSTHMLQNIEALTIRIQEDDLALLNRVYPAPTEKVPLDEL